MPMECPDCGARLTAADREADDYRCGRCGALVREPRRTPGEDYDARPRRRRPPKRGGRGLLLVLGTVGLLTLLACGGVIGAVAWAGKPRWEEYRSPTGNFTVELPAKARTDMAEIAADHGPVEPGVTHEGTILIGKLEVYRVMHGDLDPDTRATRTDEALLDELVKNLRDDPPPAQIVSSKDVTVSGYKARELHVRAEGQNALVRIVVTRTRWYTLIAGGPLAAADEPRLRQFVESFKLTEPRRDDGPAPLADKWRN
jgi:DNA-directed RNA polymerase subunit RPC12/RpoP